MFSIRRLGSVSVCTEPLKILRLHRSMSVFIFLTCICSISWLFNNHCEWRHLGFLRHASLRDRPSQSLDFRWCLCMYFFQWCKINKGHLSFSRIIMTYNLWILSCFLHSCKEYRTPRCSGRDAVDCDSKSTYPLSSQNAKERPRKWFIVSFGYEYNGKLATLLKNHVQIRVSSSALCELLNHWKRSRIDIYVHLACPCNFSSGQLRLPDGIESKFQKTYSRFPESCWKRRNPCDPTNLWSITSGPFETYVVLRTIFLPYFLLQLLQRILPA